MKFLLLFFPLMAQASLSVQEYHQILDEVYEVYSPLYSQQGATFKIVRSWKKEGLNAKARIKKDLWWIDMWGGYAKHPLTTKDGFTAFVCHEIGHHFGGYPYWNEPGAEWSSAEGQADYYAATKCLRILWRNKNNGIKNPFSLVQKKCADAYSNQNDQKLCIRIAHAGLEMINPLAYKPKNLAFDKPNTWETTFMFVNQHPGAQCRVDTFLQGAICPVSETINFDEEDETIGACSKKHQGARPRCWFLPQK